MYLPATHRNPSPKTMLIKTMKCMNTQQWLKKTKQGVGISNHQNF
jgi:hypothetical protein